MEKKKKTCPAFTKQIYNLLSQFLCSLPGPVNAQYVHSLLGHVTVIYLLGKPWGNSQFTERKRLQFTEPLIQRAFFEFT